MDHSAENGHRSPSYVTIFMNDDNIVLSKEFKHEESYIISYHIIAILQTDRIVLYIWTMQMRAAQSECRYKLSRNLEEVKGK